MTSNEPDPHVAREVRAELARQGISGSGLAKAMGQSRSSIQRRLAGEQSFTVDELLTISRILGVPISQFWPLDRAS